MQGDFSPNSRLCSNDISRPRGHVSTSIIVLIAKFLAARRGATAMQMKSFWKNRRGAVAPMFGLLIVPLLAAAGVAIDYSQAGATRVAFQNVLDATALMLQKTAPSESAADLQAQATAFFNAQFSRPGVSNPTVTATYSTSNGSKVVLTGSAMLQTYFSARTSTLRHRRPPPGAIPGCGSRSCSTILDRWRVPARWTRSRPRRKIS
jgi:Flp pilus assembly protein TadG